jgi:hypothetical protein
MTVRVMFNQTCDRCERPFNQTVLKAGDTVPDIKSRGVVVYATTTKGKETVPGAKPVVSFSDLCDGCREAVDKLIERLALRKPAPKEAVAEAPVADAVEVAPSLPEVAAPEAPVVPIEKAKRKRGRPSKAELAARQGATPDYTEAEQAAEQAVEPSEVEVAVAVGDDPFPGHETFEDPDTGDVIDVHTGEVLAQRVDGKVKSVSGGQAVAGAADHPF